MALVDEQFDEMKVKLVSDQGDFSITYTRKIFSQIEIDVEVIAVEYKEGQNWGQRKGQWDDEVLCEEEGCVAYDIPMGMVTDSN